MTEVIFSKISGLALAVNEWRIFPRIFIVAYIILLFNATDWFMALENPNTQQAGFVSTVIGTGAAWFGLYVNGGPKRS